MPLIPSTRGSRRLNWGQCAKLSVSRSHRERETGARAGGTRAAADAGEPALRCRASRAASGAGIHRRNARARTPGRMEMTGPARRVQLFHLSLVERDPAEGGLVRQAVRDAAIGPVWGILGQHITGRRSDPGKLSPIAQPNWGRPRAGGLFLLISQGFDATKRELARTYQCSRTSCAGTTSGLPFSTM